MLEAGTIAAWVSALKLPTKIIAGLFAFTLLMLLSDYLGVVDLAEFGKPSRAITIIAAMLLGCLSAASLVGAVYDHWLQRHKTTLLSARRDLQRADKERIRREREAAVLKRIDFLSSDELHHIADCLRANEQSFTAFAESPHVSNLRGKGIVTTPGGRHHEDHYPFCIPDFVWAALLERRAELIAKDEQGQQSIHGAGRGSRRRVAPYIT